MRTGGSASRSAPLTVCFPSLFATFRGFLPRAVVLMEGQSPGVRPLFTGSPPPKMTSARVLNPKLGLLCRGEESILRCIEGDRSGGMMAGMGYDPVDESCWGGEKPLYVISNRGEACLFMCKECTCAHIGADVIG